MIRESPVHRVRVVCPVLRGAKDRPDQKVRKARPDPQARKEIPVTSARKVKVDPSDPLVRLEKLGKLVQKAPKEFRDQLVPKVRKELKAILALLDPKAPKE